MHNNIFLIFTISLTSIFAIQLTVQHYLRNAEYQEKFANCDCPGQSAWANHSSLFKYVVLLSLIEQNMRLPTCENVQTGFSISNIHQLGGIFSVHGQDYIKV